VRNARFSWWRISPEYWRVASAPTESAIDAMPIAHDMASGSGLGCIRTVMSSYPFRTRWRRTPGGRRTQRTTHHPPTARATTPSTNKERTRGSRERTESTTDSVTNGFAPTNAPSAGGHRQHISARQIERPRVFPRFGRDRHSR
jgi:hypothetical protein